MPVETLRAQVCTGTLGVGILAVWPLLAPNEQFIRRYFYTVQDI
jgi:hypothetical protein